MIQTIRILPLGLLLGVAWACEEVPEEPPRRLDPECRAAFEERGRDVLAEHAACQTDADCARINNGPGCISPFHCSIAVSKGQESAFVDLATAIVDEYIAECGNFCAVTDCVSPEALAPVCDTDTGLCTFEQLREPGAVGD